MTILRQETETGITNSTSALICISLIVGALISSLFFQKINAEFFALSGITVTTAFIIALLSATQLRIDKSLLPLALIFLFWGWIGVATLFSPVTFISLGTFWTIALLPISALSVVLVSGNSRTETATRSALFAVIAMLALYACVKFFVFDSAPRATFANKNNFAALQMPVAFYTAIAAVRAHRTVAQFLFLSLVGLFVFTIGIIGSRAVLICLVTGLALIFLFLIKDRWPRKPVAVLLATVFFALLASNFAGSGALVKRTETLLAPASAGNDRFVIWEGSLELAKEAPWHGIGPGLYPMVYPTYRLDEDRSAAFFVHNDYLQFYIEAGWPAPLLLIAGLLALAVLGFRRILASSTTPEQRMKLLAPLLGVGAIAGHSLLSFNLFLPSLLILTGILVGLTTHHLQLLSLSQQSPTIRIPRSLALLGAVLAVLPALYFIETGRSALLHKQSVALSDQNELSAAITLLDEAADVSPGADIYHYSRVWQWFREVTSEGQPPKPEELSRELARLEKAERLNPLRPQIQVIRARILEAVGLPDMENTNDARKELLKTIEEEYRTALKKDPFNLEARFYLARFLLKQNQLEEGQAVLENGIDKPYPYNELSVNYYRLTAELRRILGDTEGYQSLMTRLREAVRKHESKASRK